MPVRMSAEDEERNALASWLRAHLQHYHFCKEPKLREKTLEELQQIHCGYPHGEKK